MTKQGWCEGEKVNITAAAVAGLIVKSFSRREVKVILAFLGVLLASLDSLLLADSLCSSSLKADVDEEEEEEDLEAPSSLL